MTPKIAIFFHCLFFKDDGEPFDRALSIVMEQMEQIKRSGIISAASYFEIGINGGEESVGVSELVLPKEAVKVYHGLSSKAENLTIIQIENWAKTHPDWLVLYFHAKGSTHPEGSSYGINVSDPWRRSMMHYLVAHWRECVSEFANGHDVVCCRWLWSMADGTQHIPAGNFLWITSNFVKRLPSMFLRERIKMSGISAAESRYEAEVYWGNGPRPNVCQILPQSMDGIP